MPDKFNVGDRVVLCYNIAPANDEDDLILIAFRGEVGIILDVHFECGCGECSREGIEGPFYSVLIESRNLQLESVPVQALDHLYRIQPVSHTL